MMVVALFLIMQCTEMKQDKLWFGKKLILLQLTQDLIHLSENLLALFSLTQLRLVMNLDLKL